MPVKTARLWCCGPFHILILKLSTHELDEFVLFLSFPSNSDAVIGKWFAGTHWGPQDQACRWTPVLYSDHNLNIIYPPLTAVYVFNPI
jgi:hypothetical protein